MITYIYYILIAKNLDDRSTELQNYITCESNGHNPEDPCDKSKLEELQLPVLETLTCTLTLLIPLAFVFDVQKIPSLCSITSKKATSSSRNNLKS